MRLRPANNDNFTVFQLLAGIAFRRRRTTSNGTGQHSDARLQPRTLSMKLCGVLPSPILFAVQQRIGGVRQTAHRAVHCHELRGRPQTSGEGAASAAAQAVSSGSTHRHIRA